MKVLSTIVRGLAWIVYLVIIVSLLIAAPILLGNRPVVVLSGSMEPAYPVGSITYYKEVPFNNITVGDAITFQIGDGSYATHRVTAVNETEQSFTTKGDHNDTEDANPVLYSNVKGRTAEHAIPFAGYFISNMQHWYVIAGCGLILLLDMLLTSDDKKQKKLSVGESVIEGLNKTSEQDTSENS